MTSGPHTVLLPTRHTPLRLRLKPKGPTTGYVDGAWWPRSRDLTAELPALAEVLAVRLGRIERVAYALSAWDTTPRRFKVDDYPVHMEGFSYQDRNIIHLTGSNRGRISLLVVPSEMTDPAGHDVLMTAGRRGNTDRTDDMLATATVPAPRQAPEYSAQRWDNDGGHVHQLD